MSNQVEASAWLVGNTMKVQVGENASPLVDPDVGAAITTASITATVVDAGGTAVAGVSWPVTLNHVGGGAGAGNGVYRAYVSHAAAILEGARYTARITIDVAGVRSYIEAPLLGTVRTGATRLT